MCDRSDFISNDFRSREIQRVFVRVFCATVQWASRRWIKVCLFDWKFTSINTAVLYCGHYISSKNTGWLPNLYHCISILSCLFISIVQIGFVELFTVVSSHELKLHCWLRTAWLVSCILNRELGVVTFGSFHFHWAGHAIIYLMCLDPFEKLWWIC